MPPSPPLSGPPAALPRLPRRRPRLVVLAVLPTLITLGNLLAGVIAVSYLMDSWGAATVELREKLWEKAAWMVFVGMVCDALDGRVARLTGAASSFGAELDSLADVVTFGLCPALLAKSVVQATLPEGPTPKLVTTLVAVYALCAALRLARYNVESSRISVPGHVTRVFRGLPSPGAAGVMASLVLLRREFDLPWLSPVLLGATPVIGLLMISRFPYAHLVNRYLVGKRSPVAIVLLAVTVALAVLHPEAVLAAFFCGYALSGPVLLVTSSVFGGPRWVTSEDEDEEDDEGVDAEADDDAPGGGTQATA
jgi:CDP-diacylglycerol--serine O-phosphatidyltransferase